VVQSFQLCIIIPYYNNLQGLIDSVKSIRYALANYLILIIDDGSNDILTESAIDKHIELNAYIKIVRINENAGIVNALNTALQLPGKLFNTKFIARLDCGDLCLPERFSLQTSLFVKDPDLLLVGSWCIFKDYQSHMSFVYKAPALHKDIQRAMNFRNVFIHPTVMWRYSPLLPHYPDKFPHAEDYALFYEMTDIGKTHIIPIPLVICEINRKGISYLNRKQQLINRERVIRHYSTHSFLRICGIIKLKLLQILPVEMILKLKNQISHPNS
jgi:glycosyltransferase involved in cell wall biosynthesis